MIPLHAGLPLSEVLAIMKREVDECSERVVGHVGRMKITVPGDILKDFRREWVIAHYGH